MTGTQHGVGALTAYHRHQGEDMSQQQRCTCTKCPECNGSGYVWFSFGGKYLGSHRSDDLDEMEPCDMCRNGIIEVCEFCAEEEERHES